MGHHDIMDLVLLISIPALLAAGYFIWDFWFNRGDTPRHEAQPRRREDARDWQRRFGLSSLLATNFLQPTQNEILETLYVLDHLTPGWETGDPGRAERNFLNELALSFPLLCKAPCAFPLPFAERLAADPARAQRSNARPANEEEVAASREEFRVARAHANALEQMVSGPTAHPAEVVPGSLPFRVSPPGSIRGRDNPWPARLAGAMVLGAAVFGTIRFLPVRPDSKLLNHESEPALVQVTPIPTPAASEPSPTVPATVEIIAEVSPAPSPAPVAVAVATPAAMPTPIPSTPDPAKAVLVQQIAASKQRALDKYPELAVEGSEINVRFVFRYKTLVQQNSPRLLDPNWPEKLVEECAAASGSSLKHTAFTQVTGARR